MLQCLNGMVGNALQSIKTLKGKRGLPMSTSGTDINKQVVLPPTNVDINGQQEIEEMDIQNGPWSKLILVNMKPKDLRCYSHLIYRC